MGISVKGEPIMSLAVDIGFVLLFALTVWISAKRGILAPTMKVLRLTVSAAAAAFFGAILASRLEYHLLDVVTQRMAERLPHMPSLTPILSDGITTIVAILVSYTVLFLGTFALMTLLIRLLIKLTRLPVLSSVDKLMGGALGIALGGLLVAALSSVLRVGLVAVGREEIVASSLFLSLFAPAA